MSTLAASSPARTHGPRSSRPWEPSTYLGTYADEESGHPRRIVARTLSDGSVLVLDTATGGILGARLVARLAPDEPPENAEIVCELYLADESRGRCRPLSKDDLQVDRGEQDAEACGSDSKATILVDDEHGRAYRIAALDGFRSIPELRWVRGPGSSAAGPWELLRLRDVIGAVEAYEPARSMTVEALKRSAESRDVSTCRLDGELQRLADGSLLLNRGLREAVQRTVARGEISMSEIARRCGQVKHAKGKPQGGDSSWLERRIGLRPEAGARKPHRWIRSDVMARIARDGLGISPNEVEL